MSDHYILDGHVVVSCDLMTWARWLEGDGRSARIVKQEEIGESKVSTVFLGLNHQFDDGPPLLFETMVFGGSLDQEMDRYSTWEEAEQGHEAMVERVRNATGRDTAENGRE